MVERSWPPEPGKCRVEARRLPSIPFSVIFRTREIKIKAHPHLWVAQKRNMNNSYTAESWSEGIGIFKCLLSRVKLESALFIWTPPTRQCHQKSSRRIHYWRHWGGALCPVPSSYRDLLTWGRSWCPTPRVGCSHLVAPTCPSLGHSRVQILNPSA